MRKEEGGPAPSGERECWAELLEASKALRDCGCFGDREWDRAVERMDDAIEACEDEAEGPTAQPSPLTWSREKPKVPGHYLVRCNKASQAVSVVEEAGELSAYFGDICRAVSSYTDKCEWAGPIIVGEPTPPEGGSQ